VAQRRPGRVALTSVQGPMLATTLSQRMRINWHRVLAAAIGNSGSQ
jgi:hypothetical protein